MQKRKRKPLNATKSWVVAVVEWKVHTHTKSATQTQKTNHKEELNEEDKEASNRPS